MSLARALYIVSPTLDGAAQVIRVMLAIHDQSKIRSNCHQLPREVSSNISNNMLRLLDPNGAGKSALARTIPTLRSQSAYGVSMDDTALLSRAMAVQRMSGCRPHETDGHAMSGAKSS